MILPVTILVHVLAIHVVSTMDVLPIFSPNKLASKQEREAILQSLQGSYSPPSQSAFLPENDDYEFKPSRNVLDESIDSDSRERLSPLAHDREVDTDLNNAIMKLFGKLRKYQRNTHSTSKRLWGRRNIQTRFASFGTKLVPNRKMLLGSTGSTILRYGRSAE